MSRFHSAPLNAARIGLLTLLLGAATAAATLAAPDSREQACRDAAGGHPYVCYDHQDRVWVRAIGEVSREGQQLQIVILNTDPDHIVSKVERVEEPDRQPKGLTGACTLQSQVETIYPSEGRYTLAIGFDETASPCSQLADVEPTEFKVDVVGWEQSIAGAFMGSDHKDPKFSTYTRQVSGQTMTFVESEPASSQDEARLGLGSFIHLYNERVEHWAEDTWARKLVPAGFSFGLGIGEQNRTTYAVGPSWKFGDKAFLTLGYSWAPVDRLPNGVRTCPRSSATCDPALAISDANRIASLNQRNEGAFFVGLSYSFVTVGNFFQDRFQKAIQASTLAPAAQPAAPAGATVGLTCAPKEGKAGREVTVTPTVTNGGTKILRLVMDKQFVDSDVKNWSPCTNGPADKLCFEVKANELNGILKFKLKQDAAAGSYKPALSIDGATTATCDVVVTP